MTDQASDQRTAGETRRVLISVADEGNRRVLEAWVNGHSLYTLVEDTDIVEAAFDCCLLDGRQLGKKRFELLKRKESEQIILPYLLLVPESRHREIHDRLRDEHPELWDAIDGVIDMPVTEHRLGEQLETFFRLRSQSVSAYTQREQLRQVRDQLDVLNRVLRHDIRNDMNVVVAWGEMLEDEVTPAGREKLDRILRAGRHVVELTNVARDLSALTHGDETPDRKPIALRQVLTAELEKRRETFSDAEITMPEPPDPGTHVLANELLSSVFRNLVNNAVQHNRTDQSKVVITVEDDAESVRISVADNGPGVPDDVKAELFRAGEKGLESGGTGMGLFLVDSLVEGYGGNVWIEDRAGSESSGGPDEADQTGAVFVVELPTTQKSDNREESSK